MQVVEGGDFIPEKLRPLAYGPAKYVTCYNGCNVNGFKFHTHEYGYNKITMNSGVCIKDSWWEGSESDYYGILKEVIKLSYIGGNSVILFKCQWFDNNNGIKIDPRHGITEIKYGSKAYVDEPFVLAQQASQVYYTPFPSKDRGRKDWWAVCKIKSRVVHYELDEEQEDSRLPECYQEDETLGVHQSYIEAELDAPGILLHDSQHEEIDHIEFISRGKQIQEGKEEEEDEEDEEMEGEGEKEMEEDDELEDELDDESEGYQSSEEAIE